VVEEGENGMEERPVEKEKPKHGKEGMAGDAMVNEDHKFEGREENGTERDSQSSKEELIEIKPREGMMKESDDGGFNDKQENKLKMK